MSGSGGAPLILVLEDEAVVAMELETRLVSLGYRVAGPVATVDAALALAQRTRPDLLLADIRLQGATDGIAAAAALRAQLGVPVVYLSAHADAATLTRAIASDPFGYLTKPLRESELHATLMTALHRDRLERKLESSEARFRAVFEGTSDALLVVDPDGVIKLVNAAAESMFGYARGTLQGVSIGALVPGAACAERAERRAALEMRPRACVAGTSRSLQGLTRQGQALRIELGLSQFPFEGETCVVVAARDVSEKERAAEELARSRERSAQTQRLEAVGRLAGGVAHDFNNLLTVILGMSRLLEPMLLAQPRALVLLRDIREAGGRAADLVSRLLAFARRNPVQARLVDMNAEVDGFTRLLSRVLGSHIEFVAELSAARCHVWIDPSHVDQLLLNLAVNARDAMPDGGRLWLRTRAVSRPEGESSQEWVILEVEDEGCGMSEEVRSRVFEPFFTTKEFGDGTGLGLSIVYGLVTQAGGEVVVRSAEGEGTTFTIWLPAHEETKARKRGGVAKLISERADAEQDQ